LLWVESVSERLLGVQEPRPWERVYFDPDAVHNTAESAAGDEASGNEVPSNEAPNDEANDHPIIPGEDPSVTIPTTTAEGHFSPGSQPREAPSAPRVLDLTGSAATPRIEATDDDILHAALVSGNAGLAGAVVELLDGRARDQARIASLERALRVLLAEVGRTPDANALPAGNSMTAVLQRVLGG
jgi:hypothetical protein